MKVLPNNTKVNKPNLLFNLYFTICPAGHLVKMQWNANTFHSHYIHDESYHSAIWKNFHSWEIYLHRIVSWTTIETFLWSFQFLLKCSAVHRYNKSWCVHCSEKRVERNEKEEKKTKKKKKRKRDGNVGRKVQEKNGRKKKIRQWNKEKQKWCNGRKKRKELQKWREIEREVKGSKEEWTEEMRKLQSRKAKAWREE